MVDTYKRATRNIGLTRSDGMRSANGGAVFKADDMVTLKRMLILGTDKGSFYESAEQLTTKFINQVNRCLATYGADVVELVRDVSSGGLSMSNDHALLALAVAASYGLTEVVEDTGAEHIRYAALNALPDVARTGTHLLHFVEYVSGLRGWGTVLRREVARWYTTGSDSVERSPLAIAKQVTKYASRDGWSHADVLRLTHPTVDNPEIDGIFNYVVNDRDISKVPVGAVQEYLMAVNLAKDENTPKETVIDLIHTYHLPREVINTTFLGDADVWAALLPGMPIHALLRNLGTLTRQGVISTWSDGERVAVNKLVAPSNGLLHPLEVLKAQRQYASGQGYRSGESWKPSQQVVKKLEQLFYDSFGTIMPTGQRLYVAIDVSHSMSRATVLEGLSAAEVASVLAMAVIRTEPFVHVAGFATNLIDLPITPTMSLDEVTRLTKSRLGENTYCSAPIADARLRGLDVDAFIMYTDGQTSDRTSVGSVIRDYRRGTSAAGRLVVNQMQANNVSLVETNDPLFLNLVGTSSTTPQIISEFVRGQF